MTYGDIYKKFTEEHKNLSELAEDYRPADPLYGVPYKDNTIVVWLNTGETILYTYNGKNSSIETVATNPIISW